MNIFLSVILFLKNNNNNTANVGFDEEQFWNVDFDRKNREESPKPLDNVQPIETYISFSSKFNYFDSVLYLLF